MMNFDGDNIKDYDETLKSLLVWVPVQKCGLDLRNRPTPPVMPSIDEPPVLEL